MIEKNCVFVIGAGASQVYRYPTGMELKERVIELLNTPAKRDSLFSDFDSQLISAFRESLIRCGKQSVDAFLENRTDFIEIGKYAISSVLTQCEKIANLFVNENRIPGTSIVSYNIQGDWLAYLYNLMDASFYDFHKNNVQFITFNYDRSIETFFFEALKNSYNKTDEEVAEILNKIKIIHVHGQLGFLNWQKREKELTRAYTSEWRNISERKNDIKIGASGIKIIHETNKNSSDFIEARSVLKNGGSILFLGFGYAPRNVERLEIQTKDRVISGTVRGLSKAELQEVNTKLFQDNFIDANSTMGCLDFLRELPRRVFRE